MILKSFFCLFLVLIISYQSLVDGAGKCASKKLIVHEARDCVKGVNPHFRLLNFTVTLTNDCHLVPRFCFVWLKQDFNTYATYVNDTRKAGGNLCEAFKKNKAKIIEAKKPYEDAARWDLDCPTSEINFGKSVNCIKKGKTDISQHVGLLRMVGNAKYAIRTEIWHSDNPNVKSCFYSVVQLIQ